MHTIPILVVVLQIAAHYAMPELTWPMCSLKRTKDMLTFCICRSISVENSPPPAGDLQPQSSLRRMMLQGVACTGRMLKRFKASPWP